MKLQQYEGGYANSEIIQYATCIMILVTHLVSTYETVRDIRDSLYARGALQSLFQQNELLMHVHLFPFRILNHRERNSAYL